jgi:hypothetical protein
VILNHFSKESVNKSFGRNNIQVYGDSKEMFSFIKSQNYHRPIYLLMSSGDFDGFDITGLVE